MYGEIKHYKSPVRVRIRSFCVSIQLKTECIERLKSKVKLQVKKEAVEPTEDSGTVILPESNPAEPVSKASAFLLPQLTNLPSLP